VHNGIRYVRPVPLQRDHNDTIALTVDFRTVEPFDGSFRLYFGRGVIESLALECSVSANEFAIRGAGEWHVLDQLAANQWYSLRLLIDTQSSTCSGVLISDTDSFELNSIAVNPSWDGVIDTFISDGIGHRAGQVPTRDIDNLGLQYSAFPSPTDPVVAGDTLATHSAATESAATLDQLTEQIATLEKRQNELRSAELYPVAYGVSEGKPVQSRIQIRGEPERLGDTVPRQGLALLGAETWENPSGSGRDLLAKWLVDPRNPLTARVFVNRIWQWHFGQGLVATPSDFGSRGELPTHPELLDYLATELIRSGWSLKQLHRAILLTQAYQQSSQDHPQSLAIDPSNRNLWKFSRRPLDAESLRDAMLLLADNLDRGLSPAHPFPNADTWAFTIHNPFHANYETQHRSIYQMVQRNRRHPFFALFDGADPNLSVASRFATTTPTQSLYLLNSPFVHTNASLFGDRVRGSSEQAEDRIRFAWRTALGRLPTVGELEQTLLFMQTYQQRLGGSQDDLQTQFSSATWHALGRVLLTSNAFLYID
jgi:hypothetical protein